MQAPNRQNITALLLSKQAHEKFQQKPHCSGVETDFN